MYKILKSFAGSQNGTVTTQFNKGETVELSDYLVSCIPDDWVEKVGEKKVEIEVENKAIITKGKPGKRNK